MPVERLSRDAMRLIVTNKIKRRATCIIKVYANHCKYCHELQETYEQIVKLHPDVYFFAFNIADDPVLEKQLGFDGVPTILSMKTGGKGKMTIMPEPEKPHDTMWYRKSDIEKFIEENK